MKFWLQFLERFGTPSIYGKIPAGKMEDSTYVTRALDQLEALRQDAVAVIPDDLQLDIMETSKGTADYANFDHRMDKRISKIVLSQTMTTDAEGGNYKGEVHKAVRDEVVNSDAKLICESFNRQVVSRLVAWNFPGAANPVVSKDTAEEEDKNERADVDTKVYAMGYEPDEEYIEKTYGTGWVKRAPGTFPANPGNLDPNMAQNFSEIVGSIGQNRIANRADQDNLAKAARQFAERADESTGDRIRQLVSELDDSQDLAAFSESILAMMAEPPPDAMVEAVQKPSMIARILGNFRGQRDNVAPGGL